MNRIIVLGILRSGTSLVADLVRRWGAYAGQDSDLWSADAGTSRQYGYLEHRDLQQINDDLLDGNDRRPPAPGTIRAKLQDSTLQKRAVTLLDRMDDEAQQAGSSAWVWKDARLPFTLPFWSMLWGEVTYVVPIRHPLETIISAGSSEGLSEDDVPWAAGLLYWQAALLEILHYTQAAHDKFFVAYDWLLANPAYECGRLAEFLDKRERNGREQRLAAMLACIEPGRQHHRRETALVNLPSATREQRALYNFVRVKTLYPDEAYNADDFAMYPGWLEYLCSLDQLLTLAQAAQNGH